MNYAIIGFGKVGHALAKAFARNGVDVSVATTRDPASFASDASHDRTHDPSKKTGAVRSGIVFLAVGFESHTDVAKALPASLWRIDAGDRRVAVISLNFCCAVDAPHRLRLGAGSWGGEGLRVEGAGFNVRGC